MNRNYTTQMDAARKKLITREMEIVAQKENLEPEKVRQLVADGQVAICANKKHMALSPEGIGSMLHTKINVNLGISRDCKDYDLEMQKVMEAVALGAESIMDLSSHGNTQPFRQKLTAECPAMIGTVPIYDSVIHYQRDLAELTAQDFLDVIRLHAEDGVDFVTLHCGITRDTVRQIRSQSRKMNIVSRGGSLVFAWMSMTGEEPPFYEYFDQILDICAEYDVTISLGDACRPGCLADATDNCQLDELSRLGELVKRAWARNVQVMMEGPGHVPLNQIAADVAKGLPGARELDDRMAAARRELDWEKQFACALDAKTAQAIRQSRLPEDGHSETCSMCGKFCAVRSMNKALNHEYIDIL